MPKKCPQLPRTHSIWFVKQFIDIYIYIFWNYLKKKFEKKVWKQRFATSQPHSESDRNKRLEHIQHETGRLPLVFESYIWDDFQVYPVRQEAGGAGACQAAQHRHRSLALCAQLLRGQNRQHGAQAEARPAASVPDRARLLPGFGRGAHKRVARLRMW